MNHILTIAILAVLFSVCCLARVACRKKQTYFDRTSTSMGVRCLVCGAYESRGYYYASNICGKCRSMLPGKN